MDFDRPTLEALHRVRLDPSMKPFVEYLERRLELARDRLEGVQDIHQMTRMQGAAIEVRQIIEDIQGATKRLDEASRKPVTGRPT